MINSKFICQNCKKEYIDKYEDLNQHNKKIYCDYCAKLFFKLSKDDEYKEYQVEQALIKIQEHKAILRNALRNLDLKAERELNKLPINIK